MEKTAHSESYVIISDYFLLSLSLQISSLIFLFFITSFSDATTFCDDFIWVCIYYYSYYHYHYYWYYLSVLVGAVVVVVVVSVYCYVKSYTSLSDTIHLSLRLIPVSLQNFLETYYNFPRNSWNFLKITLRAPLTTGTTSLQ